MILIPYDGSPDADAAVERAVGLRPGASATVLTVWLPARVVMPEGSAPRREAAALLDDTSQCNARELAEGAAQRARDAGLRARPLVRCAFTGSIGGEIASEACVEGARLIVMGCRGAGGGCGEELGSVARAVLARTNRPVVTARTTPLARPAGSRTPFATVGAR
jgi:nucleotide-binding universal stress UspA family protein